MPSLYAFQYIIPKAKLHLYLLSDVSGLNPGVLEHISKRQKDQSVLNTRSFLSRVYILLFTLLNMSTGENQALCTGQYTNTYQKGRLFHLPTI